MYLILYRLYQLSLFIIVPVAKALSLVSGGVRRFHRGRGLHEPRWQRLAEARTAADAAMLWFCSSAGEFEQALPLMGRIGRGRKICHAVVFFSQSGLDYVARRYPAILAVKAPYDRESAWQQAFSWLQPELTIIVRYELWPSFLAVARQHSRVAVIDAAIAPSHPPTGLSRWLRAKLLSQVDEVFVTGPEQIPLFAVHYGRSTVAVGDTKYDRVDDRRRELSTGRHPEIKTLGAAIAGRRVLMVGSGWPADISPILTAYKKLKLQGWVIVIAPHDVSSEMMAWTKEACAAESLGSQFLSGLAGDAGAEVIIIDKLGILFELYHLADLVFVGGGMDRRVHNVLEPAIFTRPIAFGPGYHHSQEAVYLTERELVSVVDGPEAIAKWWAGFPHTKETAQMAAAMASKLGASERIAEQLSENNELE